jgi:hypothetical protein
MRIHVWHIRSSDPRLTEGNTWGNEGNAGNDSARPKGWSPPGGDVKKPLRERTSRILPREQSRCLAMKFYTELEYTLLALEKSDENKNTSGHRYRERH